NCSVPAARPTRRSFDGLFGRHPCRRARPEVRWHGPWGVAARRVRQRDYRGEQGSGDVPPCRCGSPSDEETGEAAEQDADEHAPPDLLDLELIRIPRAQLEHCDKYYAGDDVVIE